MVNEDVSLHGPSKKQRDRVNVLAHPFEIPVHNAEIVKICYARGHLGKLRDVDINSHGDVRWAHQT